MRLLTGPPFSSRLVDMTTPGSPNDHSQHAPATRFVHAGVRRGDTNAVATGIEVSTTFKQNFPGEDVPFDYARAQNPTRQALEEALAAAEGARHAMAYSSGLAAIDSIIRLLLPGDRVMLGLDAYGGTWRLLTRVWERFSISVDVVDLTDLEAVHRSWTARTRLLLVETPSNPRLQIVDISKLAETCRHRGALLAVDSTFATPALQQPLSLGAHLVTHSTTKYLGGHSDVVGGAIMTDDDELATELQFHQKAIGAVPGPFDSFLVLRGLRTLSVRMQRHCENAQRVADFLHAHPAVARVYYPGLVDHPGHELASRQMRGFGGMVSFTLKGGETVARDMVTRTRLFTLAESLGAVESLIEHPSSMTHASSEGSLLAVDPALVRLSVGIEDADDLLGDLDRGLAGLC